MKKLLIFCLILLCELCACTENEYAALEIVSSMEEQIQSINEVRLDRIILKLTYRDSSVRHMVLEETMVETFDYEKTGKQYLTIHAFGYSLNIVFAIYDENLLKDNYIFYWKEGLRQDIMIAPSIFRIPDFVTYDGQFAGWYLTKERAPGYLEEPTERIVRLYPLVVQEIVHRIDFYENGIQRRRSYVFRGGEIPYYTPDLQGFKGWSRNEPYATQSMRIDAVVAKEDEVIVYFYDRDQNYEKYEVYPKGAKVEDCMPGYASDTDRIVYVWSQDVSCLKENVSIYPIRKERYKVVFKYRYQYSSMQYQYNTQYVPAGEDAVFPYDVDLYEEIEISGSYKNVHSDLEILVILKPKYQEFYMDGELYAITIGYYPTLPEQNGYTAEWVEYEEGKFKAVYSKME